MRSGALGSWIDQSQSNLKLRLDDAARQWQPPTTIGDARMATDSFLVAVARHLSSVSEVIMPAATQSAYRKAFLKSSRTTEQLLATAKARAYGQGQAARVRWTDLWPEIRTSLDLTFRLENQMVMTIDEATGARLRQRLVANPHAGLTRTHPHLPHSGRLAGPVRRFAARADQLWDELQGRVTGNARTKVRRRHRGWNWRMTL